MRDDVRWFRAFVCAFATSLLLGAECLVPAAASFSDDFSRHAEGSSGAPTWNVLGGQWKIRQGKLAQTADGEGHAIAADAGLRGSYRIEARFRTVAGIPGEGVLFGMRDPRRGGPCHVVRVDPEGLYYGSIDAAGEFRGDGPVPALVEASRWNTLAVAVNAVAGTYAIEFNGVKVADGLALEFTGPALGLVSNWGEQEFALCAATPLELAASGRGPLRSERRGRSVDIAAAGDGRILVLERGPKPLRLVNADGTTAHSFGRLREGDRPIALEIGPQGEVYVLDEESGRIDRYPAEGGPAGGDVSRISADAEPQAIAVSPPLEGPRGLGVFSDGRIAVAESRASRVAILSPSGERVGQVGEKGGEPGKHERPSDVAVDSKGRVIVADFRGCRVQAFRPEGEKGFALDARSPWMAPPGRLAICRDDRIAVLGRFAYYETGGAIRLLEPNLMPRGFAGCFAAGNITEEGGIAAWEKGGSIYYLGVKDAMLYRFPDSFEGEFDVKPKVSYRGKMTFIAWTGHTDARPSFEYREEPKASEDVSWRSVAVGMWGDGLFAAIEGLDPERAYEYRFAPHYDVRNIAPDAATASKAVFWSKPYRVFGPEPQGKRRCLDLSLICPVYLSYLDEGSKKVFTLERDKLGEKFEREFKVACDFYARNTRLRLNVHADFEIIEKPPAVVMRGWIDPSQARRDLAPLLEKRGKKVEDYDSIVAMWAEPGWRADVPDDPGTVGGGGLTSFGYSSFGIGGRLAWLVAHEYHHQVDAFFNRSGYLDYPLNHPDATVQPGRYGQHWDCNAFYLRSWADQDWFLSKFGKVLWTADTDGDGLPDRDPLLAFDEARLGTDPAKKDTDGDGLSDLDELMVGTFRGSDPLRPDTDGDGVADGKDALPLNRAFSGVPILRKGAPAIDGTLAAGEWQEIGLVEEPKAVVSSRWDGDKLCFAVKAGRAVRVAFEVDGANNGWFLEDDNASVEVEVNGTATPPVHGAPGAKAAGSGGAAAPVAEIALPGSWVKALALKDRSRFGLCVRVMWREGEGEKAYDRELFMSEPWELLELGLGSFQTGSLKCEYLTDPLGIDVTRPRLSWNCAGSAQSAYRVLVASSPDDLDRDLGNLWDSGKVESDESVHVVYAGKPLESRQRCYWKVQTWDQGGEASAWSEPARWSMGLLKPEDWKGKWIGLETGPEKVKSDELPAMSWIWFPEGSPAASAPVGSRYFRKSVELPAGIAIKKATIRVTADNDFAVFVNGKQAGTGGNFHELYRFDVTDRMQVGPNTIAIRARNAGDAPNPAGAIGFVRIELAEGAPIVVATDASWRSSDREAGGWEAPAFDDAAWKPAQVLGANGMAPWGELAAGGDEARRLPARYLRREFDLPRGIRQATVHICGLGLFELQINGEKVGENVLEPALTDYTKRSLYVTYDVTDLVEEGKNAVGVILGNGRYFAPRVRVPTATVSYGVPRLMFDLRVEYEDGSTFDLVSDESWKLTANGPIRANNEYDGEEYDARLEMPGWSEPGFDASAWQTAQVLAAPGGVLAAQMIDPIGISQEMPLSITSPKPGVFIADMQQNMVGWCKLEVRGPRGTEVTLRFAETLTPDGLLYLDNIRGAKVTDVYILKGDGEEVFEPRFTYHGFRYVEVKGYPGELRQTSITGWVVHDRLPRQGWFWCSNELLNEIHENISWGVRGNYRSIPTDCPQRDERQGWLGDRSAESRGESYLFDVAAFYAKWMVDIQDAQRPNGSVPDVAPAFWPIYSDNVTWPSSYIIIPGMLYDVYADTRVLERHYPTMKKWIDFMSGFIVDDIMPRDTYGDWCVPPEEQRLIHSNDPARKTPGDLIATAYFYHDLGLMARYAKTLGKPDDATAFEALAERLKVAFNRKFLNAETGQYANGAQTASVLPLAFGMVPAEARERVFKRLADKIMIEGKGHIGTGLIGGQWLMRVLSDNGRPDVAYTIATQKDYPSWGYMIGKGATTIWELWNGDTADPAMNSGNHVMLVGDLLTWMHEYLGGIRPDPAFPGFKRFVLKPCPVGDLSAVSVGVDSPHGMIESEWRIMGDSFLYCIHVPCNTRARVYVPAKAVSAVTDGGLPIEWALGVTFVGMEGGYAVFEVGAGEYTFESKSFR